VAVELRMIAFKLRMIAFKLRMITFKIWTGSETAAWEHCCVLLNEPYTLNPKSPTLNPKP